MEFLNGLTIVAALSAEENELASERVGPLESQLNFVIEGGGAIEEAATLVIDLFEEAVSLNHGAQSSTVSTMVPATLTHDCQTSLKVLRYQKEVPASNINWSAPLMPLLKTRTVGEPEGPAGR